MLYEDKFSLRSLTDRWAVLSHVAAMVFHSSNDG